MIRAIREKDFTFSDEVLLSSTKDPIREILCAKYTLRVTDCKSVGSKVILKGIVYLELLYLDAGEKRGEVDERAAVFPGFLDGLAEESRRGDSARFDRALTSGAEVHIGSESEPDNDRLVSLRLYISAFVVLREVHSVCCVADLYSTMYDLSVKAENVELSDDAALFTRERSVREKASRPEPRCRASCRPAFPSARPGRERKRETTPSCARRRTCACCLLTRTARRCSRSGASRSCRRPIFQHPGAYGCIA